MSAPARGLLVDFGGVLTTSVFVSIRAFCETEGLDADAFFALMRDEPEARALLRRVETGAATEEEFTRELAARLGVASSDGLIERMFALMEPEPAMVDAVRRARAGGVRTGLLSNSLGRGRYDRQAFPELFDGVVISGEVGLHKPQPEIYLLGAERIGLAPEDCVFVDDLAENCAGAEAVGMAAILHRDADGTIAELERLLGVPLRA